MSDDQSFLTLKSPTWSPCKLDRACAPLSCSPPPSRASLQPTVFLILCTARHDVANWKGQVKALHFPRWSEDPAVPPIFLRGSRLSPSSPSTTHLLLYTPLHSAPFLPSKCSGSSKSLLSVSHCAYTPFAHLRTLLALFPGDTSRTHDSDEVWPSVLQEKNRRHRAVVPNMLADPHLVDTASVHPPPPFADQLQHCGVSAPVSCWTRTFLAQEGCAR